MFFCEYMSITAFKKICDVCSDFKVLNNSFFFTIKSFNVIYKQKTEF